MPCGHATGLSVSVRVLVYDRDQSVKAIPEPKDASIVLFQVREKLEIWRKDEKTVSNASAQGFNIHVRLQRKQRGHLLSLLTLNTTKCHVTSHRAGTATTASSTPWR